MAYFFGLVKWLIMLGCSVIYLSPSPDNPREMRLPAYFDADISHTWRLWCHELIDWSQPTSPVSSNLSSRVLFLPAGDAGDEVYILLKSVGVRFTTARPEAKDAVPMLTKEGVSKFVSSLRQIKPPYWSPDLMAGNDTLWSDKTVLWGNQKYLAQLKQNHIETLINSQQAVNKWVIDIENFPTQFPKDHYLAGYASLYGSILRANWDTAPQAVVERLATIEATYGDIKAIKIMSRWYKLLLQMHLHPQDHLKLLHTFVLKNSAFSKWNVVQIAQKMIVSPRMATSVVSKFLNSPLRDPSKYELVNPK